MKENEKYFRALLFILFRDFTALMTIQECKIQK